MERKEMNPDLEDAEGKTRKMLVLKQKGQISPSLVEGTIGKQLPQSTLTSYYFIETIIKSHGLRGRTGLRCKDYQRQW